MLIVKIKDKLVENITGYHGERYRLKSERMGARRNRHKGSLPPCMFQPCPHDADLKTPKKEANLSLEKIVS